MIKPAGKQPTVEVIRYGQRITAILMASDENRSPISWAYRTLTPRSSMPSTKQTKTRIGKFHVSNRRWSNSPLVFLTFHSKRPKTTRPTQPATSVPMMVPEFQA